MNPANVQDLKSAFYFSDSTLYLITDRIQMTETLESEGLLRHLQINVPDSTNQVKYTNQKIALFFMSKWTYSPVTVKPLKQRPRLFEQLTI